MSTTAEPASAAQINDLALRGRRRLAIVAVVRTGLTIASVVAIYFLLPLDHGSNAGAVAELALGVLVLVAIIVWQIRRIVGATTHQPSR